MSNPLITIERIYDNFTHSYNWKASLGPLQAFGRYPTDALNALIAQLIDRAVASLPPEP